MCGLAGIITRDDSAVNERTLKKMTDAVAHRGPDGENFWIAPGGRVGLGHRRLAVIDLSAAAGQPMHYLSRFTVIHNGEIYNYVELREELSKLGYTFQTHSDTEVIAAAYARWGAGCLEHFDGMFAFACWDRVSQTLFCARDRFGEKPLFYSPGEKTFFFASEIKALWSAGVMRKINHPLLLNYLALGHSSTAADNTITFFQDVFSLPPAHYLTFNLPDFSFELTRYWDCDKVTKISITIDDAAEKFNELFRSGIKRRMRSDVALGTSLSGGLDSSSIAATIAGLQSMGSIDTFSAVFDNFQKNEAHYIDTVVAKFQLKNHQVHPSVDELIDDLDSLCWHQEIPFSSSSVFAQYKVFEAAQQFHTTVLLDGQGADETMGGYQQYAQWYLQELLFTRNLKFFAEKRALKKNGVRFSWDLKNYAAAWFPAQTAYQLEKREIRRLRHFDDVTDEFRKSSLDRQSIFKPIVLRLNDMLYFSTMQYGLEELLRYADRNSMAFGREVRLPFLNHQLVEFLFSLPSQFKIRNGYTKWILRKAMENDLPSTITWRKDKIGFEPPQKRWLESPRLQEMIRVAKSKLIDQGILKPAVLNKKNQPQHAFAAENYDWRYLIAARCIGH